MMADREKVLKGLERCTKELNIFGDCSAMDCPYILLPTCCSTLAADALELLKAQEPRIITDADFISNPNMDSQGFLPAWIEYRRDGEWFEYWGDMDDEWSSVTTDSYKGNRYRCWTSRPTDEQRKAVKWE